MSKLFSGQARLVAKRPGFIVAAIVVMTIALGGGFFLDVESQDQASSFLPEDNELALAQDKIAEDFGGDDDVAPVQIIVRGNVLTPAAITEALAALDAITNDPLVAPELATPRAFGYPQIVQLLVPNYQNLTSVELTQALDAARDDPALAGLTANLDRLVATDDGVIGGLMFVNLMSSGNPWDDSQAATQLRIEEVLDTYPFQEVDARSFSNAKLNEEAGAAQGQSTGILMVAALGVILVLLVVFYRTGSDVVLSMSGLILTVVWVFGAQGYLGAFGVIGGNNPLAIMVPVLLIGLTVDYALQFTSRYRERLQDGDHSSRATFNAVRFGGVPLFLAAATTAISFLTNLTSALPPIQDFGVISGIGVMFGWLLMTTWVPAWRTIMDRRNQRKGRRVQQRLMTNAIPGVSAFVVRLSRTISRHPAVYLIGVAIISGAAFVGAANISTEFSTTDFLPDNTESYEDLVFVSKYFAGGGSQVTILVEGELLEDRLIRNLLDFESSLNADPVAGMTGPVDASLLTLIVDLATDSGVPGDKYDAQFAQFLEDLDVGFVISPEQMESILSTVRATDPAGFDAVVALRDGTDRTLIRMPVVGDDAGATRQLIADLETRWPGPAEQFTVTGSDVLSVAVTDEMTEGQVASMVYTILAAVTVLLLFFGITEQRPLLGVITVIPIALVVGWVLGSMYLLGISYNIMTALITALTIGVGVDYTIHITHRFIEEQQAGKSVDHALSTALGTTGGALIASGLTTALGFAVLVFSPLVPLQQLGGLISLTIIYSLIASFVVLPPMLVLWAAFHEYRLRRAMHEIQPMTDMFYLGGIATTEGRVVVCPSCETKTFVPRAAKGLRCPNLSCTFTGSAPDDDGLQPIRQV